MAIHMLLQSSDDVHVILCVFLVISLDPGWMLAAEDRKSNGLSASI